MLKRFEEAEGRLLSLEHAFNDVCEAHGLDREVMRKMSSHQFYTVAAQDLEPDARVVASYREVFESTLN